MIIVDRADSHFWVRSQKRTIRARLSMRQYRRGDAVAAVSNDIVVEAWNTVLFEKFVRFKHLLIDGLSGHSEEVFARQPHFEGARVLDVGCGFGDSTIRIAKAVGPTGEAVGD